MALRMLIPTISRRMDKIYKNSSTDLISRHSQKCENISRNIFLINSSNIFPPTAQFLLKPTFRNFSKTIRVEDAKPITATAMKTFLNRRKIAFEQGFTCLILSCVLCPHLGKLVNKQGKMYINLVTGLFLCHSCRMSGTWQEFEDYVTILQTERSIDKRHLIRRPAPDWILTDTDKVKIQDLIDNSMAVNEIDDDEYANLAEKFNISEIRKATSQKFSLRISKSKEKLLLPIYGFDGTVSGIKQYFCKPGERKVDDVVAPKRAQTLLYGWQRINQTHRKIILTAYPKDAIIITQELNIPALSLPKGISNLPLEVLPLLEQFQSIVLWFGGDVQSWEAAKMFARKLGETRCYFLRLKERNLPPYEAKVQRIDLSSILKDIHPIGHKSITTIDSLKEDIYMESLNVEQVAGVKWQRYPTLTKILKGHRRGELTVVTGPTGSGKTTFMSEYSLDLCVQGVSTLWGSFEIKTVRLARMMLTQYYRLPLDKHLDKFDEWIDKFSKLPLYFMTFQGEESIKNVIAAMTHAVYVYDIQHIVVDNLQFMMGIQENASFMDRLSRQDAIIASFRRFTSINNVHVSLVIHPKKEKEDNELHISSIFGGAKASQEADNILILQDKRLVSVKGKKYIQVVKNRFSGDIGIVPLEFDKDSLSYTKIK